MAFDPIAMPPDLVIRHGRSDGKSRIEQHLEMADLIGRSFGERRSAVGGELSGVRATRDKLIQQEIAGGCNPATARAQLDRVAATYDRSVREGREPPPRKGY